MGFPSRSANWICWPDASTGDRLIIGAWSPLRVSLSLIVQAVPLALGPPIIIIELATPFSIETTVYDSPPNVKEAPGLISTLGCSSMGTEIWTRALVVVAEGSSQAATVWYRI